MENDLVQIFMMLVEATKVEGTTILIPLREVAAGTAQECLQRVSEFNLESVGRGIMAFCYSVPTELINES